MDGHRVLLLHQGGLTVRKSFRIVDLNCGRRVAAATPESMSTNDGW
jgi:hypothetical protein